MSNSNDSVTTRRIFAFIIDFFILTIVGMIGLFIIMPYISDDQYRVTLQVNIAIKCYFFSLPIFKDMFGSFGKKVMKLQIYSNNHSNASFWKRILRNITLPFWFIEMIVFLTRSDRKRLGDIIAKTYISIK